MDKSKLERLKKITAAVNKVVKDADVQYLGNDEAAQLVRITSQAPSLDGILGGGWPMGRLVEIYGAESTGKTTLCYHALSEFQKNFPDDCAAWIDAEFSFDTSLANTMGVKTDEVLMQYPEDGEQALEVIKQLIVNGVKFIVIDSVAALTPRAEREKQFGEKTMGETARLLSTALKQLNAEAARAGCLLMFTNQTREKIGVMYGDKTTTTGGKALGFYSAIRIVLNFMGYEKEGEVPVSVKIRARCKKNKTAAPGKECQYTITFGMGIDSIADIFNSAVALGVIEKAGAWFSFNGQRIGQGKMAALATVRNDTKIFDDLCTAMNNASNLAKDGAESKGTMKKPKLGSALPTPSEDEPEESSEEVEVESV